MKIKEAEGAITEEEEEVIVPEETDKNQVMNLVKLKNLKMKLMKMKNLRKMKNVMDK